MIGADGPGRIRAWAPYNSDIVADQEPGRRLAYRSTPGGDLPAGMRPFPLRRPDGLRIRNRVDVLEARGPGGRVVWRITVEGPMMFGGPVIGVPDGGIAVLTASGHLVVLDPVPSP